MTDGKQRCQIIFLLKALPLLGSLLCIVAFAKSEEPAAPTATPPADTIIPVTAQRTRLHYSTTEHSSQTFVVEHTEYSEGSKLSRIIGSWSRTQFPLEIVLVEDYHLPMRPAPGSLPHNLTQTHPFQVRPTTFLAELHRLSDEDFVASLDEHCFEDEWTAIARLKADHIEHRTVHNSTAAQSGHGVRPFFSLGYVVCVKSAKSD